MGLLDKVTAFLGGHGVSVALVSVGNGHPDDVHVSTEDDAFEFTARLIAEKEAVILSLTGELSVTRPAVHGGTAYAPIGKLVWDEHTDPERGWPIPVAAGASLDHTFSLHGLDFARAFAEIGHASVSTALADRSTRVVCRVVADVKHTPVDPTAEVPVTVDVA
jgi:hypothetical protein